MIQFKDIENAARDAYNNKELFEFLTGRKGYDLRVIDAPVDVPTDWPRVIKNGIYEIYKESPNEDIVASYEKAIKRIIDSANTELWIAVNILYFQFDQENGGKSPFAINKDIIKGLKDRIIDSKGLLEKEYPYGKNGWNMYEDILRLDHNFNRDWGYSLLG